MAIGMPKRDIYFYKKCVEDISSVAERKTAIGGTRLSTTNDR